MFLKPFKSLMYVLLDGMLERFSLNRFKKTMCAPLLIAVTKVFTHLW